MPDYTPFEDMLWALKDTVIANVGARLTAIKVAKADGILLPDFKKYGMGYRDPFGQTLYPYVMFMHDDADIEDSAIGAEYDRFVAQVIYVLKHKDRDNLTKMDFRYAEAIRGVINENDTLGGAVLRAQATKINWYSAMDDMSAGVVRVEMIMEILV